MANHAHTTRRALLRLLPPSVLAFALPAIPAPATPVAPSSLAEGHAMINIGGRLVTFDTKFRPPQFTYDDHPEDRVFLEDEHVALDILTGDIGVLARPEVATIDPYRRDDHSRLVAVSEAAGRGLVTRRAVSLGVVL
jgi:hypothetical protein